jgi:integrase
MISLPNGCSRSNLTVSPSNWKSCRASTKKKWRIIYRFYQSDGVRKQIPIQGMNGEKDLQLRQAITRHLIENEITLLSQGYNPIIGKIILPVPVHSFDVPESTPFLRALRRAIELGDYGKHVLENLHWCVNKLEKHAIKLCMHFTPVVQIRARHILQLLKFAEAQEKLTAQTYNHLRAYLMMLFKQLLLLEAVDSNPVRDIPKKRVERKLKKVLSIEQRRQVNDYLRGADYNFWRYMRIFFHSGCRSTELHTIKVKDVDLSRQCYVVTVLKGGSHQVRKTITKSALPFWEELLKNADPEHYVFGRNFEPGKLKVGGERVTKYWYYHIKKERRFGIDADFYAFKHANTTEVVDLLDERDAAALNAHTSTAMVVSIYDTRQEQRKHERLKEVDNSFV